MWYSNLIKYYLIKWFVHPLWVVGDMSCSLGSVRFGSARLGDSLEGDTKQKLTYSSLGLYVIVFDLND
ncbi:hypothetical protein LguiB_007268 [Lonicera macranthoides]